MHEDQPPLGSTVGPWLLLERLDSGSFGVVYRARRAGHPDSPPVAVKMARRPRDARFEREVDLLQHCPHAGIPRFEDAGLWTAPNGQKYPYVVMELVEGFTLYDWFAGTRTSREVLHVLAQVAGALASAHGSGAIHRDVKGDNIRVTAEGRAVLVDWGSGWFSGARPLTDTTAPPGTTAYRSPEQRLFSWRFRKDLEARWQAQPSDDLYSLGVAIYRCVTGLYLPPLSEGGEVAETREVPPPSDYATVSKDLEALILRLLANQREQRGTAEALARDAAAMATAAGEVADMPIVPTESARDTDGGGPSPEGLDDEALDSDPNSSRSDSASTSSPPPREERRSSPEVPAWLAPALAAMVGGLVVALLLLLSILLSHSVPGEQPARSWEAPPQEVAHFAPDAGVVEEVVASVQDVPQAVLPSILSLGRPMPTSPLRGQRRPPCPRGDREINSACWVEVAREKPPCGDTMFDYDGACYKVSMDMPRQPTSEEP